MVKVISIAYFLRNVKHIISIYFQNILLVIQVSVMTLAAVQTSKLLLKFSMTS